MESGSFHNSINSLWRSYSDGSGFAPLSSSISVDVAIIGGGITGITAAQLLKESGFKVAVLEAYRVGGGSTGHSTGNLYTAVEEGLDTIQSKYDTDTLKTVISARGAAINLVEQNVGRFSLDCDFKRQPWYLYSSNEENAGRVEKEYKAAMEAGAAVADVVPGELPFTVVKGIRMDGQAQFNPLRYVQQLAKAIAGENCSIYENTRVEEIDEEDEECVTLKTEGGNVVARYVIHATHTPKGVFLDYHSLLGTYREYGVAVKLASGNYPEGIFWGYFNANDRFSLRSYEHDGEKYLVAVGQPHEVGQKEDNHENIANIENFLREHFDVLEVTNRWGGQNYKPADGLPYIGRKRKGSNIFVATGFSTDGLTYGTLAAMIIRDIITGKETEYTTLFDATRHNPLKAAGKFIKENAINAAELIKDYLFISEAKVGDIPANEGKVIEVDGRKVAVFHTETGEVKACSAICTHLGCVVHFNKAEKTWDCPCHASRFDTDGRIIEGPALVPLKKVDIREDAS